MANIVKQLHVTVADAVGKLAEVTGKIKDAGVNIFSLAAWTEGDTGRLIVITEDNDKVADALAGSVQDVRRGEAIYVKVPHQAGELDAVAGKLAEAGIAIELIYATTAEGNEAGVVLMTSDNAKAVELL